MLGKPTRLAPLAYRPVLSKEIFRQDSVLAGILSRRAFLWIYVGLGLLVGVGFQISGKMGGELIRMDEKGRVLIPLKIRRRLGMKNLVRIRVEDEKVVLEPVPDPLDIIKGFVIKGTEDVEREIRDLRKIAEKELSKEAEGG